MAEVVAAAMPSRATIATAARISLSRVTAPAVDGAVAFIGPQRLQACWVSSLGSKAVGSGHSETRDGRMTVGRPLPIAHCLLPTAAMSDARFLGIDFSGGAGPWRPVCARPTVWIAALEG